MSKIPFYVGNFLALFVRDGVHRARVRGSVNVALYTPRIKVLIKRIYNERVDSIKFVRQINLNRFVCVVNDKYYVKVFRNITLQRVKEHMELVDMVRPHLDGITIPDVYVDNNIPMYVCEKISGHPISDFDVDTILKNEEKIKKQVADIITKIQRVDLDSIPNNARFLYGLQPERQPEKPTKGNPKPVLAHFDLNETNLFFDKDMNITGVIDWDTLSIAKNPETDMNVFNLFWGMFKKRITRKK